LARLAAGVLIAAIGVGTGWIAGKRLSGAVSHSAPDNIDTSIPDSSTALQPELQAQPPAKEGSSESQAKVKSPSSVVKPEAEPQQEPEIEKERADIPNYEEATKEIGRKALKRMMKDIQNTNRSKPPEVEKNDGNKNN
jgi:hypothetical protein